MVERTGGAEALLQASFFKGEHSYHHSEDALMRKAKKELNETPESKARCVRELEAWLASSKEHVLGNPDEEALIKFLRHAKYSVKKAKNRLTNYYELPRRYPDWFGDTDPTDPDLMVFTKVVFPLPGRDSEGRGMIIFRPPLLSKADDMDKFCTYLFMTMDLGLMFPEMQVHGGVMIVDHAGMGVAEAAVWSRPSMLRRLFSAWLDAYPIRVKCLHHFNHSALFDVIFAMVRPFLSAKMARRFRTHASLEQMCEKDVDRKLLPAEYGGEAGTIEELQEATRMAFKQGREALMTRFI